MIESIVPFEAKIASESLLEKMENHFEKSFPKPLKRQRYLKNFVGLLPFRCHLLNR